MHSKSLFLLVSNAKSTKQNSRYSVDFCQAEPTAQTSSMTPALKNAT